MYLKDMTATPKTGQWWSDCCERDLKQIKSQSDIDELLEWLEDYRVDPDDEPGGGPEIWDTEIEALTEIKSRYLVGEIDEDYWAGLFRAAHDRRGPICTCRFQITMHGLGSKCPVHDNPLFGGVGMRSAI
jgi:hypothetical protein